MYEARETRSEVFDGTGRRRPTTGSSGRGLSFRVACECRKRRVFVQRRVLEL